ncbi:MAG TPA: M48 family metallopeptidase [Candidatus Dormibacteraeota bacterium]|nr:M48 family metallopeptidase [Candidatus Dormibacteraeota bacterium]
MSTGSQKRPRLRHPFEIPVYIVMVFLNFLIAIVLIGFILIELSPSLLHTLYITSNPLRLAVIAALIAMLLAGLVLVLVRQLNRASVRGSSVLATEHQFSEINAIKREGAAALGFHSAREPEIYVAAGNGVLNAFAASAFGHDFVVVNSDLFANTLEQNQRALRFIVGHELGHIKLGHTRLWYQLSTAYSGLVPLLAPYLSRLRELSCDRHGAWFESEGEDGLILLAAGRYIYHQVQLPGLLEQAQRNRGFWNAVVQLPLSHPLTIRRIRELNRLGMIHASPPPRGEQAPAGAKPQSA